MGILKAKTLGDDMLIILSTEKIERPHPEFPLSKKMSLGIFIAPRIKMNVILSLKTNTITSI